MITKWSDLLNGVLSVAAVLTMTIAATVTVHASSEITYRDLCDDRWNLPKDVKLAVSNLMTFQNQMHDALSNLEDDERDKLDHILSDNNEFRIFWEKNDLPHWGFSDSTLKLNLNLMRKSREGLWSKEDMEGMILFLCFRKPLWRQAHLNTTITCLAGIKGLFDTPPAISKSVNRVSRNLSQLISLLLLLSCVSDISQQVNSDQTPYP